MSSKQQPLRTGKINSVSNGGPFTGGKHGTSMSLYTISL